MLDAEAIPVSATTSAPATHPRTPDLRQRQRDRMSPRRPFAKTLQTNAPNRDAGPSKAGLCAQPTKGAGPSHRATEYLRWKQAQEGARHEESTSRRKKSDVEDGKVNITPDGGSAGREGRQFTVSKVGNNGRIYLRPTIRPANQRYPQPAFTFPSTPPSTAGLETFLPQQELQVPDGTLTPLSPPTPSARLLETLQIGSTDSTPNPRHKRAHSYSTIDEQQSMVHDAETGAFKVIIERPGGPPKPTEAFYGIPTLEVPIPSYKLGTPRFSIRGTAFLRNSSHTGTEDVRSSVFSGHDTPRRDQSSRRPTRPLARRHSDASPQPILPVLPPPNPFNLASLPTPQITRLPVKIAPEMFDVLTFKPDCDHPSVVRYSATGSIRAATPARLVAEITSPTFVDYDLLSDFFLTFRAFLDTADLLHMLIARLKWALARDDEVGTIVRVRTFVALRHWILNYFLDDFVIDYDLRKSFCDLLNNFVSDLSVDRIHTKIPLKILGELKKCWRRVCALYWDGSEFDTSLGPDVDISPGGAAGSRDPRLDGTFWHDRSELPPRLEGIIEPDFVESESAAITRGNGTFFADVSRAGHLDTFREPSIKNHEHLADVPEPPLSPTSILSEEVVSCSFPTRGRAVDGSYPLGAHPVAASSVYESSPHVATTPKALNGKRVRPNHAHKRSGSFSDSFRDNRLQAQPVQKVIYKSTEILLALPYAGSLVRGNLLPPGQAFVDVVAPSTPAEAQRATTLFPHIPSFQKGPSAMSGPGMKRLLGSVRRALSTRQSPNPNSSPTQGSFPHIPPLGIRGATINRLPGTAVVPQARRRNDGAPALTRIDLLGAEVAEDFKRAVEEDAEAEAEFQRQEAEARAPPALHSLSADQSPLIASKPTLEPPQLGSNRRDLVSGVTQGSQSIVIVDDTLPPGYPVMTGALPVSASVDTFAEAFARPSGGPTPPTTPPTHHVGTPRRSSHLLGHHPKNLTQSIDDKPSLIVDSRPSVENERSLSHRLMSRPSTRSRMTPYRPKKSTSLRRYASFQSGFTHQRSERSFDATTFSDTPDIERISGEYSIPAPLRVLRRRPGGDLRAVSNVGDLDARSLRRPMSTGSLLTYTESVRSSFLYRDSIDGVEIADSVPEAVQDNAQRFSLGALAEPSPKRPISLFSTHSSQPIMRPSFEKEARFLAQIPDDADDDGGVESALLKLEGKYEKRQSDTARDFQDPRGELPGHGNSFGVVPHEMSTLSLAENEEEEKRRHRHEHIEQVGVRPIPVAVSYRPQQQPLEELKPVVYQPRGMQNALPVQAHHSVESYNSIPLLDRGLTDDEQDTQSQDWTEKSILREPSKERKDYDILTPDSSHPNSFNFVDETESIRAVGNEQKRQEEASIDQSFLDSDSDVSDLSSELSLEVISRIEYTEQSPMTAGDYPALGINTVVKELALPSHPLRQPSSPTGNLPQGLNIYAQGSDIYQPHDTHKHTDRELPPSPEITPTNILPRSRLPGLDGLASPSVHPLRAHEIVEPSRKTSVHLPFILAFDSQILAQQFTLIEKDALNEIDWKDLIEMRWKDRGSTESRSWVDFLRTSEPHGVEVVIARFNLMVKWAVSECVLTLDLHERVRCIIKFIHIAAQCRKYRNFATLTQLTVALTSKDIARLTKTWVHVPEADVKTLRELETLVTPSSNFHNLRAEMEGSGADQGCIPFVGIYTHDLLVNQERPSQIASTPTTEPLTNFERCRTDATIVKNLLRLLEASQLYRFLPIEGVTERCLWMAALTDEDIGRYGSLIQP